MLATKTITTTLILLALSATVAHAAPLTPETAAEIQRKADSLFVGRFPIDDHAAEIKVPTRAERAESPIDFGTFVMELLERGERATQRKDYDAAAKYYRALVLATPEKALPFSLLCNAYDAAGVPSRALDACAAALRHDGVTVGDYQHYAQLVLALPGELPATRISDLDAIATHLDAAATGSPAATQLRCDIAVRLLDEGRLRACTSTLETLAPDEPKTLRYEWTLALLRRDYAGAEAIVARAKHSTMRPAAVAALELATQRASTPWHRVREALRAHPDLALATLAAVLLALAASATLRQRLTRATR